MLELPEGMRPPPPEPEPEAEPEQAEEVVAPADGHPIAEEAPAAEEAAATTEEEPAPAAEPAAAAEPEPAAAVGAEEADMDDPMAQSKCMISPVISSKLTM